MEYGSSAHIVCVVFYAASGSNTYNNVRCGTRQLVSQLDRSGIARLQIIYGYRFSASSAVYS